MEKINNAAASRFEEWLHLRFQQEIVDFLKENEMASKLFYMVNI